MIIDHDLSSSCVFLRLVTLWVVQLLQVMIIKMYDEFLRHSALGSWLKVNKIAILMTNTL